MKKLYFLFLISFATANVVKATNYYVSASTGSDLNNGKSIATAFATITKFSFSVNYGPGDTIFVMNGVYTGTAHDILKITRSGTALNPIVFKNYPGHTPEIDLANWNAILIDNASYIVIDGFKIRGNNSNLTLANALNQPTSCANHAGTPDPLYNGNGINVDGRTNGHCHHITIRNNQVFECPGGGISAIQSDYITIDNNTVYSNAWYSIYGCSGISILNSFNSDTNTGFKMFIRNNTVYGNRMYVPWVGSAFSPCAITDGNGIIYDTNNNSGTTLSPYTGQVLIENNLSYQNGGRGIHAFKSNYVTVRNNTTYQNNQSTEITDGEITMVTANNCNVYNNIMYANPKTGGKVSSYSGTNLISDGNIVFGSSTIGFFNNNDKVADPLFVDAPNGNFTLQSKSPAINAATYVSGQYALTDILGVARPVGAKPDIGAFEYTGSLPVSTDFSPGDIVALRVGDGSTSLSTNGAPVTLTEYAPSGVASGISFSFNNTSPSRLTVGGASFTEDGQLSLSGDGRYLSVMGYDAAPGSTSATMVAGTKVIARLDSKGTVDYTTRIPSTAVNSTCVVSDNGARFWYTGNGGGSATRITNFGGTTGTFVSSDQMRSVGIYDTRLYSCALSSASSNVVYYTGVDPTQPTSNNKINYPFPGFPIAGHVYQSFVLLDQDPAVGYSYTYPTNTATPAATATINTRFDVLYCSDINLGLVKFYYNGTTWVFAGSYNPPSATGVSGGLYSLTAKLNTSGQVTVYAVKGSVSNNNLVQIVDAGGRTGNISTTVPTSSTVASAGANFVFKGIAFSPAPVVTTAPAITSVSASTGIKGDVITITGTSLQGVTAVSLGGTAATSFTEISPNSLTAVVGAGSSGSITVTTANGIATLNGFIYKAPILSSFTPTSAGNGTTVSLKGKNFTVATAVSFGGTASASFTVTSDTTITAKVGIGATGNVSVTTPGGMVNLAGFTYINNALDKTGVTQSASSAYSLRQLRTVYTHTAITPPATISGFNNSITPVVRIRRSSDDNQLDIGYTASGDLDTVTLKSFVGNAGGYVSIWYDQSSNSYDVVQANRSLQPVLVTNGVVERSGVMPALRFITQSQTVLQANVPASSMFGSGYIGSVFPVLEASGASVTSSAFGYGSGNDRWQVHAIQGLNFDVGNPFNRIYVTNNAYTGVIRNYSLIADVNLQQIYVNGTIQASSTASMTPCTQNVFNIGGVPNLFCYHNNHESEIIIYNTQLSTADRQTVETNQVNYYAVYTAPTLASFTPANGSAGTSVTITGTNFNNVTGVSFGGTPASSYTVNSATSITAIVGSGASGAVTVTTAKGPAGLAGFLYGSGLEKTGITRPASSAYSLRQLKTTYNHTAITAPVSVNGFSNSATPVARVRRSADNAQLDIGYTATGDLDTVTLKSFVGTGNGYVTTWYDQSSNSYDVTQSSAAQQPVLVTNGVVERSGAMPAIRFNNASQTVLQNNVPASAMFGSGYIGSAFPVMEASGATVKSSAFGYGSGSDRWQVHAIQGANFDVGNPFNRIYVTNNAYTGVIKNYSLIADANLQQIYVNGILQASSTTAMTPCTQAQFNIGGIPNFFCYHDNHESEIIIYNIQLSTADRQTMESNQYAYYNPQSQSQSLAQNAFIVNINQPVMTASASSVKLNFNAMGGEGNSNYQVQKMGTTGFSSIASLSGTGTGDFTAADSDPLNGNNYYRIAATDSKGKLVYSETVNLNVLTGGKGILVYPNPVTGGSMVLNFNLMNKGVYNLTLADAVGKVVLKKVINYDGYSSSVTVAVPNTRIGVYILNITSDIYQRTLRLIFK